MQTYVYLRCPRCRHEWHFATLTAYDEMKPEQVASQPYCPKCDAKPPMQVVRQEAQGDLFEGPAGVSPAPGGETR